MHRKSCKELDRINGLDMYDQIARQYSPVLGGFTSIDPLCEIDYPISPYVFCAGNPIRNIDPTGMVVQMSAHTPLWDLINVLSDLQNLTNYQLSFVSDGSDKLTLQMNKDIKMGSSNLSAGNRLISDLIDSPKTLFIATVEDTKFLTVYSKSPNSSNGMGINASIYYGLKTDTNIKSEVINKSNILSFNERPSYIGLGHELVHSLRAMNGNAINYDNMITYTINGNKRTIETEEAATIGIVPIPAQINDYHNIQVVPYYINENMLRLEHGLDMRVSHDKK